MLSFVRFFQKNSWGLLVFDRICVAIELLKFFIQCGMKFYPKFIGTLEGLH